MFQLLKGIKVLDLSTVVLGPFASQLLADLGANIIKLEPPEGDMFRAAGPARHRGMGAGYLNLNRNKRSLVLDLKTPEGRAAFYRLAKDADVLLHNMRPGAVSKLGLDLDSLRELNPTLIYCAAVGFGGDGPYANEPAYDDVMQAISGLASLYSTAEGIPAFAPTILADKICGLYTAFGIVASLLARERTQRATSVEMPMFESMVSFLLAEHLSGHTFEPPVGGLRYDRVMLAHRRPYRTADGYIAVLPYAAKHWRNFLNLVGREDLAQAEWMGDATQRSERTAELYAVLAEVMPSRTTAQWLNALKALDVPCGPVNSLEDLLDDSHLQAVGFFRTTEHPTEGTLITTRHPLRFPETSSEPDRPVSALGANGREILLESGFQEAEIQALIDAGALLEPSHEQTSEAS